MMITPMDALLRRLPPPRPTEPIDWADAERRLGTPLPSDLKALVDLYGPGHLAGVIELLSPVEPRSARNLVAFARQQASWSGTSPSHLLALARDANGRALEWQTIGEPDAWPIVVGKDLVRFEGTLSELLLAALDGRGPLPVRTGPPPPEPEPDVEGVDVAAALAAMPPRTRNPRAIDRLVELAPPPGRRLTR
jgi:hypothetical protein